MHPSMLIDEIEEYKLLTELELRQIKRSQGKCDYCERSPDTPSCKFPKRHNDSRIVRGA